MSNLIPATSGSSGEVNPAGAAQLDGDLAAIYEENLPLLIGLAVGRFGISQTDAETLAHDVFVDFFLKRSRVAAASTRAWLVASIFNASQYYVRCRNRVEALPAGYAENADPNLLRVAEMWPDQLAAREAFGCTTARCQLALRLRYMEGYTIPEIAEELGTTSRYAAKLVGECLRQANRRYTKRERAAKEGDR
ncbi:MAG TPA: sigma-70 family RNA polymerase sigma factor [Thermoanaerobaculia bacterium]|nr:sigma-70 family RNA polymerase sigma factor [Thermoanaerobaculia bacterium]